jgi:cell wall-associated NlpC family hydrolase
MVVNAATPADAKPTTKTVKAKVEKLYHQAEVASERYNTAREQLKSARTTLKALDSDMARQQHTVDALRDQVATLVVSQYQGQALSTASQVALADDPSSFLDNLGAVSAYNNQRGEVMKQYSVELKRLQLRKAAVSQEQASLDRAQKSLGKQKAVIDEKAAAAKKELAKLEAAARASMERGGPVVNVEASGRAKTAVDYAMAQVGKPYVFGAAGPSAYDCSGLTMAAWGAAGVGLPHSSSAQQGSGTPVSESQLQPGDLVFYYQPVSHVGMYIGNGMIVNAENPSAGIKVTGLHTMPYSGAVRPG